MSRSLARRTGALGLAAFAVTATPSDAAAHALGGTYQLPVPLWLYLAAAAVAVAASFVVITVLERHPPAVEPPRQPISTPVASVARWTLRILGLVWWYGAIVVGFLVGDISPLPAVLLWIFIWVGLPIVAVLVGNPWPSLSPFRSTFAALEWAGRRIGLRGLEAAVPYPSWLARWPAVALLFLALWYELIHPGSAVAATVAGLMLRYTLVILAGMVLFGQVAWLRNAELFEVLLGWFGRIGPIGRRAVTPHLCAGCSEACEFERCVDCPECAVAADDRERQPFLRPWMVGLAGVRLAGWSDATFIVLALAGITYDGLRETAFGAALLGAILPPVQAVFGVTGLTFLLVETLGLAGIIVAFLAAFATVVAATRAMAGMARRIGSTAGAYAATLLPIAAGYLVAHYLTLVIQGLIWLPSLLADPLMSLAPALDWIPIGFVWYLSVGAIVLGHVVAIVLAHRIALPDSPNGPTRAGLPIVALMIGYTVLSLWIIAQPIVIEPGFSAAAR